MNRLLALLLAVICTSGLLLHAQNYRDEFENFRNQARGDFDGYRKKTMEQFTNYVRQTWKEFQKQDAKAKPAEEEHVLPLIADGDRGAEEWLHEQPDWLQKQLKNAQQDQRKMKTEAKDHQQHIKDIIVSQAEQLPQQRIPSHQSDFSDTHPDRFSFTFFGTECQVRMGEACRFQLETLDNNELADRLQQMMTAPFNHLLNDCLLLRQKLRLCDWAYYQLLCALTDRFYGPDSDEATLALAFLYMQSGYKMRLAQDGIHLYMLVASTHYIYSYSYYIVDNEYFYLLRGKDPKEMLICEAGFPQERDLSLQISDSPLLAYHPSDVRTVRSRRYADFSFQVAINTNLIDFFNTYPTSTVDDDVKTRWAMYARTPMADQVRQMLYPPMQQVLAGLSPLEAVERLLNWVQTGFAYGFDSEIWGTDRVFFGEETLFYPYCDCEDRSILLAHLVYDLLGLDVVLVYYPNHIAMAVRFPQAVPGDFLMVRGSRYTICDPTYIGARVGQNMPRNTGQQATVIYLY